MKNMFVTMCLCCVLGGISLPVAAAWYESTGQAFIERGDLNAARRAAIEDALQRASLVAGARLQSEQQVIQGIMQHSQITLSSAAELKQVQLLSEVHSAQQVTVTLRAHIVAESRQCHARFRHPTQVAQIHLNARHDAIHGQLFQLGEHSTRQWLRHLQDFAPNLLLHEIQDPITLPHLTPAVAEQWFTEGQQFVLLASIEDLSLGAKRNSFWQKPYYDRHFAIQFWIYDNFERRVRFQQAYQTMGNWAESSRPLLSHSLTFWQQPYGQKIDQVLRAAAQDIQQALQCQPLMTQIRQLRQQHVQLGLGAAHGLRVGDSVKIIQVQQDPQDSRIRRLIHSPLELTITEVTAEGAWAASASQTLLNHIQRGDIVSLIPN